MGIDLRLTEQLALLNELSIKEPTGPRFKPNGYLSNTDAAVYQSLIRRLQPNRVVEVGSGYSTAALVDAGGAPHMTLIEPHTERLREVLTPVDLARCELIENRLQDVEISVFRDLACGDFLFVDSTHVTKLGSDVNRIFFEILPVLAGGVIVHFHDIHYPFEYPSEWAEQGRGWNEAYLLRAFLEYNQAFKIVLWLDMLRQLGHISGNCGSMWLRKLGAEP